MRATEKQENTEVLGGAGARTRCGSTPPSRERRATHKTHRVESDSGKATERQEIGLAVRVQGLDPPGNVVTQLPHCGNFFFARQATEVHGGRELKQSCLRPGGEDLRPRRAVKGAKTRYCTFVSLLSTGSLPGEVMAGGRGYGPPTGRP